MNNHNKEIPSAIGSWNCTRSAVPAGPLFLRSCVEALWAARQQNRTATESKATGWRKELCVKLVSLFVFGLVFCSIGLHFDQLLVPSGVIWGHFWRCCGAACQAGARVLQGNRWETYFSWFWGLFGCLLVSILVPKIAKKRIDFRVRFWVGFGVHFGLILEAKIIKKWCWILTMVLDCFLHDPGAAQSLKSSVLLK